MLNNFVCADCIVFLTVAGGTMYAAVTDIAFIDPSRTVWYEITGICSGLSFLCEQNVALTDSDM